MAFTHLSPSCLWVTLTESQGYIVTQSVPLVILEEGRHPPYGGADKEDLLCKACKNEWWRDEGGQVIEDKLLLAGVVDCVLGCLATSLVLVLSNSLTRYPCLSSLDCSNTFLWPWPLFCGGSILWQICYAPLGHYVWQLTVNHRKAFVPDFLLKSVDETDGTEHTFGFLSGNAELWFLSSCLRDLISDSTHDCKLDFVLHSPEGNRWSGKKRQRGGYKRLLWIRTSAEN